MMWEEIIGSSLVCHEFLDGAHPDDCYDCAHWFQTNGLQQSDDSDATIAYES